VSKGTFGRRDVVKLMAAAGATGVPAARMVWPNAAHAAAAPAYDPAARFELDVKDVEFRRNSAGRTLMARFGTSAVAQDPRSACYPDCDVAEPVSCAIARLEMVVTAESGLLPGWK